MFKDKMLYTMFEGNFCNRSRCSVLTLFKTHFMCDSSLWHKTAIYLKEKDSQNLLSRK